MVPVLTVRRAPRSSVAVPATLGSIESVTALVLAHVAAGGEVPQPLWLAAFAALAYAAGRPVLRRRAGIRVVLPLLLAAQVLGHAWLVALTPGMHAGHSADAGGLFGLSPAMLLAHAVAGVVTGVMWALRRRASQVLLAWSDLGLAPLPRPARVRVLVRRVLPRRRPRAAITPVRGPPTLSPVPA
ncbi:hypothetical protein [Nocardioides sp. LML1-1-1.1]|uniref:hypothetical protein n=1 Tax=Nocardioides sp. LML1-1-1.1 TaxID=3135248 RepID=UPI00341E725D